MAGQSKERLRALRRKYGLGEFRKKGKRNSSPSPKRRRKSRTSATSGSRLGKPNILCCPTTVTKVIESLEDRFPGQRREDNTDYERFGAGFGSIFASLP